MKNVGSKWMQPNIQFQLSELHSRAGINPLTENTSAAIYKLVYSFTSFFLWFVLWFKFSTFGVQTAEQNQTSNVKMQIYGTL